MELLKSVIRWMAGILFVFMAFVSVTQSCYLSGVFFLFTASILIPPVLAVIEQTIHLKLKTPIKYGLVIGGYLASTMTIQKPNPTPVKPEINTNALSRVTDTVQHFKTDTVKKRPRPNPVPVIVTPKNVSSLSEKVVQPKRQAKKVKSSGYIRGPRGGCYYLSASGKKVYVDRSLCD